MLGFDQSVRVKLKKIRIFLCLSRWKLWAISSQSSFTGAALTLCYKITDKKRVLVAAFISLDGPFVLFDESGFSYVPWRYFINHLIFPIFVCSVYRYVIVERHIGCKWNATAWGNIVASWPNRLGTVIKFSGEMAWFRIPYTTWSCECHLLVIEQIQATAHRMHHTTSH